MKRYKKIEAMYCAVATEDVMLSPKDDVQFDLLLVRDEINKMLNSVKLNAN